MNDIDITSERNMRGGVKTIPSTWHASISTPSLVIGRFHFMDLADSFSP